MGYSVAVQVNNKELRAKALAFMQKNFKQFDALVPNWGNPCAVRGPLGGEDLSYESKTSRIGFDYSCLGDIDRHYVWCILYWMALTFGSKRRFKGFGPVPFYVYDGHEPIAVLVGEDWKNRPEFMKPAKETQLDGWHPWMYSDIKGMAGIALRMFQKRAWGIPLGKAEKVIRAELARLTVEWNKENGNG
jgi:hypothetical protein